MSKINQISSSGQFSKLLSSNTYVITDFYADWCGPCKAIAPVFEQLAASHSQSGKVAFAKVDVDTQPDIAQQYGVSAYVARPFQPQPTLKLTTDCPSMPTFLIFKRASVSDRIAGANPSALRTAVSRAAADAGKGPASLGAHFQSAGYTLGTNSAPGRPVNAGVSGLVGSLGTGWADSMVRFFGLYLTTLFSFDAYAAADASPFKVARAGRR